MSKSRKAIVQMEKRTFYISKMNAIYLCFIVFADIPFKK